MAPENEDKEKSLMERLGEAMTSGINAGKGDKDEKEGSLADRLSNIVSDAADKTEKQQREEEIARLEKQVKDLEEQSRGESAKPSTGFQTPQSSNYTPAPQAQAAPQPQAQAAPQAAEQRTYTVVSGDSLSKIAKRYYGDAMQWKKIYEANRDKIDNPDLIYPGQVFIIP